MNDVFFSGHGWQGILAEAVTVERIQEVARAFCTVLHRQQLYRDNFPPRLVIGYDNRFLGRRLAEAAARVVVSQGFDVYLADSPASTPAIAWAVKDYIVTGGMVITGANHQAEVSGVKLLTAQAALSSAKVTDEVLSDWENGVVLDSEIMPGELMAFDPLSSYFSQLRHLVDLSAIAAAGIDLTVDYAHGSTGSYIQALLRPTGSLVRELNADSRPDFGGFVPNLEAKRLAALRGIVLSPRSPLQVGLAFDGDGSNLQVVDPSGHLLTPSQLVALLAQHLIRRKRWGEEILCPVGVWSEDDPAPSDLVTRDAPYADFRYLAETMRRHDIALATDGKGGFAFPNHTLCPDGVLAGLLVLEAIAMTRQNPLAQLFRRPENALLEQS